MYGLTVLFFIAIYLLVCLLVVVFAVKLAGKLGRSRKVWGIVAALIMYHLAFWDLIPNYLLFKYYVHTRSGFWVYTTPEQWKEENPGVAETLTWNTEIKNYKLPGYKSGSRLNERIVYLLKEERTEPFRVWTVNLILKDIKTDEVLARRTSIATDDKSTSGFFIQHEQKVDYYKEFGRVKTEYKRLGKEVP